MGKIVSNLPNDSQPWGRDIESRLEKLEALVASNEINNIARDQRIEANLNRVSELLSNTAALKTYQAEISGPSRQYNVSGTQSGFADTQDLTLSFSIDKPRIVSFQYSVNYDAWPSYLSPTDLSQEWSVTSFINLNGEIISQSTDHQIDTYSSSNPLSSRWITSTHFNMEKISLQPGDYEVKIDLLYEQYAGSTSTSFFFQGDVLSVSIIE